MRSDPPARPGQDPSGAGPDERSRPGLQLRRAAALAVRRRRPGLLAIEVEVDGEPGLAFAYERLTGPVAPGDRLVLNTTAVSFGLGTGGAHFVVAVEDGPDLDPAGPGHAMKLRYTPLQVAILPVEETHREALEAFHGLDGAAVVIVGLHSGLAPACLAARAVAPDARVAYVMTDGSTLPIAFSDAVAALTEAGLLGLTVTCGQAFGGDLEAVNLYSGIAAARTVGGADLVVVAMGPGNLGTGSRWGFALIETAAALNAVAALGGRPLLAPRLSFADPRERHRGVSHHTLTALEVALAPAEVCLPRLAPDRRRLALGQLEAAGVPSRHRIVEVDTAAVEPALEASPVPLRSMGRGYTDDPDAFRAAAAAALHALTGE